MRLFSLPADFRTSTIDRLAELNARHDDAAVAEVYGSVTWGGLLGSGRGSAALPTVDLRQLEKYVAYAGSKGVDFNYALNASCVGNIELTGRGLRRTQKFISRLWGAGVRHLTVSMPTLMVIIEDSGYPFSVKASTICQINAADKARRYRDRGVDRMVIDEDITRDFRRIRQICAVFGDGVEMIVNSPCVRNCANKMFHYNHESHSSAAEIANFFYYYCPSLGASTDPLDLMRVNWVRPEDLSLYESAGIHRFKMQGRTTALNGDVIRAVETYMDGSYDGNLYDLLVLFNPGMRYGIPRIDNRALDGFLKPFFDDPEHCTGDCDACGYCASFTAAVTTNGRGERGLTTAQPARIDGTEAPYAAYRRLSAAERVAKRVTRRGHSVARQVKHQVRSRRED
jgi:collagenase-like PrtC family protease